MDAITLLKDDHKTVERLFKRFEKAGPNAHVEKRKIVDRIIEELSVHAAIEEQVFYPVARATVPGTEDVALESLEEHHVVKLLLAELVDLDPSHERFTPKVTVLIENVRHHVDEEETDFFPQVRNKLTRSDLADVGEALATAKKAAPTHPRPSAPDSGPAVALVGAIAGMVDKVGDNISGVAQGTVTATQDLVARILGRERPKVSPTGTKVARDRADKVRSSATVATDTVTDTARSVREGSEATAKAARAGAKGTATSAKNSVASTVTTAKRGATTTAHTAQKATKKTKQVATTSR